jgi:beta-mannosidase
MKKRKIFFIFFLLFSSCLHAQEKTDPFKDWKFRQLGDTAWFKAVVPGTVHTDLFWNNLISDPLYGLNEYKLQWIEKKDWEYKCQFDLSKELLEKEHINIVFEGLDTYAKVYLNNSLVLTADNMFRKWETDCKKLLKEKNNELRIVFESAVNKGTKDSLNSKYVLPGGIRVYTRKAQYQYGWDWSPRFVTCGIWKPLYLEAWDDIRIQDVFYDQNKITSEKAILTAFLYSSAEKFMQCRVLIKEQKSGDILIDSTLAFAAGQARTPVKFSIDKPQFWWCNGMGDPYLYHFIMEVFQGERKIFSDSTEIGLRTVELVQQADPKGKTFYFKLNGVPVFMKGANFIPEDNFIPRSRFSGSNDALWISDATSSHMNMLRVWGGGVYEDNDFYKLCDEKGILVWQDFMFACAMYPGDSSFLNNAEKEAVYQVTRLRNHPCLALWCGNNEISEGWYNWGWQKQYGYSAKDSAVIWKNYTFLFDTILKNTVSKYDEGKPYYPSSPKYGWGRKESLLEGDCHYWGVWWGMEPFEMYEKKVGRFMSEYGFQSYPADETMETYLDFSVRDTASDPNPFWHNKHPLGFQTIDDYLAKDYYDISRPGKAMRQYTYLSQLCQAYGITKAIEAHRRARPYCMGTLYWQFNDCWPGTSWSGIDYFGRWKAMQYFVKKAYSDILVSVAEENKILKTYVISDVQKNTPARLKLFLSDFHGKKLWQKDTLIVVAPLSSNCFSVLSIASILTDTSKDNEVFFAAELFIHDSLASQSIHYFASPKLLKLPGSKIRISCAVKDYNIWITLSSKKLAKNIFLKTKDAYDSFSDNYFDLLPGESKTVNLSLGSWEHKFKKRKLRYIIYRN